MSIWFWNDKFNEHKKSLEQQTVASKTDTLYGNDKGHTKNQNKNEILFRPLSFCKCYKKFSSFNFAQKEKSYRQKIMKSCVGAKSADRVRINSNSSNSHNDKSNNRDINFIDLMPTNYSNHIVSSPAVISDTANVNKQPNSNMSNDNAGLQAPETMTSMAMGIDECQIASQSQITLASHFEENNWDYNFATRGLYLNQPWNKGRYIKTFDMSEQSAASDSFGASNCGVLTLEQVTTDFSCTTPNDVTKIIRHENGESDTDGYYA